MDHEPSIEVQLAALKQNFINNFAKTGEIDDEHLSELASLVPD